MNRPAFQFGGDEVVQVAVQNSLRVTPDNARSMVLDHVRVEHVGSDLRAELVAAARCTSPSNRGSKIAHFHAPTLAQIDHAAP